MTKISLFSQIISLLPRNSFDKLTDKYCNSPLGRPSEINSKNLPDFLPDSTPYLIIIETILKNKLNNSSYLWVKHKTMETKAYQIAGAIACLFFLASACNPFEFLYPPSPPSLLDERDQQSYKIIEIGDQYWMAENLNYAMDGSWCYQNNPVMCQIYGQLYSNEAAQSACPDGWHLPSEAEFIAMEKALALDNEDLDYGVTPDFRGLTVGGQLKLDGTEFWKSPNTGATNASEFAALPAGYRYSDGTYHALTEEAWFWTSTEKDPLQYVVHYLVYDQSGIGYKPKIFGSYGLSVRCVRN